MHLPHHEARENAALSAAGAQGRERDGPRRGGGTGTQTEVTTTGWLPKRTAPSQTAHFCGVEPRVLRGLAHDVMLASGWQSAADEVIEWYRALPSQ